MGGLPSSVVTVNLGGEEVPRALADRVYAEPGIERLYNVYGPSEDTTFSTWALIERESSRAPSIGRPLDGEQAWVVDRHLQRVPMGVVGELFLGGEGVSRGYLGRPELTAERFVPDPFAASAGRPGSRMYRVGDRVRYRADGSLEFLGRLDHQVKVRGFRVELGEVEERLARVSGVSRAVVVVREDHPGDRRLVAYAVPQPGAAPPVWSEVRQELARSLPEHMLPSTLEVLEALPLTRSGKVDRRALPAPGRLTSVEVGAPRTPVEALVAAVWAEVLGVERVGVEQSFFDLGGHSLLATRVISRLRAACGVELPLRALFEEPTVARLATRAEAALRGGSLAAPLIVAVPRTGPLPLSFAQQRLWFIDRLEPGSAAYNIPAALRLAGELRLPALGAALSEVVRRQAALRTRFVQVAGEAAQVIDPPARLPLPLVDLSGLPSAAREREAGRQAAAEGARPFDLSSGPLLRARVMRLASREHVVLLTLHHIVSDGWSMGVLIRELASLYRAARSGVRSPLPELPVQYADFAVWQREWLAGEVLAAEVAYWRGRLADLPAVLALPTDRPRPPVRSSRGAARSLVLSPELTGGLRALSRGDGATLFMTLLAAFEALLSRWSGQDDFAVGSPVAGRGRQELEGVIGFFVNTLVLRAELADDPPLRAALGRTREGLLAAHAHQDLPFEKLVEELRPERTLSHTPLFQVMLTLQERELAVVEIGELVARPFAVASDLAKFDLTLAVDGTGEAATCTLEYATDLFDAATAVRLLGHWSAVLAAAVTGSDLRISQLPLQGESERHQMLREWNAAATRSGRAETLCLHELFAAQAERTPEAPAVIAQEAQLSYAELDRQAERLAQRLAALGVGLETRVGVCLERSARLVVSLLAILKAGGAYVPLDPELPPERLRFLLVDSGAGLLLTESHLRDRCPADAVAVLCLDRDEEILPEPQLRPSAITPESLAYVIYTSGSTGRPKGVMISHRGLVNYLQWCLEAYRLGSGAGVPVHSSIGFDLTVTSLWAPLLAGRAVFLLRESSPAAALARARRRKGATSAWSRSRRRTWRFWESCCRDRPSWRGQGPG